MFSLVGFNSSNKPESGFSKKALIRIRQKSMNPDSTNIDPQQQDKVTNAEGIFNYLT
jgi:hypothetical protein